MAAPAPASTPDQSLFLQPETLIGKYISILFQSNVRYEGICYAVDTQSNPPTIILAYGNFEDTETIKPSTPRLDLVLELSTVELTKSIVYRLTHSFFKLILKFCLKDHAQEAQVKDCGTEGRGTSTGGFEVPPKDYLVEHMIFLANKIVGMKILAVPHWNMINIDNLPAQEYHRMLLHYATLNLMSPNSIYTLHDYGPVIHPMASSNISINQMPTPIFGSHLNANLQRPTSKGKSVVIEPSGDAEGKSIQIQDPTGKGKSIMHTGIEEIGSSVDAYKDQIVRSLEEYQNGNNASSMKQTEDTAVLPSFFGEFHSSVAASMIIPESEPLQEVSSSEKKPVPGCYRP